MKSTRRPILTVGAALTLPAGARAQAPAAVVLTNVSYDPTRELDRPKGDEAAAQKFVEAVYKNVSVLDSGARGATTTFAQRGTGDVLIAWENEAFLTLQEFGADKFEIVVPPLSILAEPPVALVDGVVDKRGTRKVAEAYLNYLYSPAAQKVIARTFYRPYRP